MGIASFTASVGLPRSLPQVSSPDTLPSANPASFTIRNITSENNSSFVECYKEGLGRSNATIIVEGKGSNNVCEFDKGVTLRSRSILTH